MTDEQQETIRLDQFLKLSGVVATGGQAKILVQSGQVVVNDQLEIRRGRKLRPGDVVVVDEITLEVEVE